MQTSAILFLIVLKPASPDFSKKLSISGKNLTMEGILYTIKEQTGYLFLYDPEVLDKTATVSLNIKNASPREVLDVCCKGQPVSYKIDRHTILIAAKGDNRLRPHSRRSVIGWVLSPGRWRRSISEPNNRLARSGSGKVRESMYHWRSPGW